MIPRAESSPVDAPARTETEQDAGGGVSDAGGRSPWGALFAYLVIASVVCFGWLGSTDAISMEGIVADAARHMERSGDLLVPHLYGEVYAYKPPLTYWLVLGSFELLGVENEWTLRLPIALSGFVLGLVILGLVGRVCGAGAGTLCALATLTGVLSIQKLRMAEFDMPLAAGVGVALTCACYNFARQRPNAAIWLLAYLALTAAVLAKGMPALVAYGPGLIVAAAATRQLRRLFGWKHLLGVALFAVLCGWYAMGAYACGGPVVLDQPFEEARIRGTEWHPENVALTIAKLAIIVAVFLPWTALLPLALAGRRFLARDDNQRRMLRAAWAFLIAGVLAFMAVPTHETRYYLPLCTPVGIVAGMAARGGLAATAQWLHARRLTAACCTLLTAGLTVGAAIAVAPGTPAYYRPLLLAVGLAAVALVVLAARGTWRSGAAVLMVTAAICLTLTESLAVRPRRAAKRTLRPMARQFAPHVSAASTLWVVGPVTGGQELSSLFFHLNRPVRAFELTGTPPPAGTLLVLTARQRASLENQVGFRCTPLETLVHQGRAYELVRFDGAP